MTCISMHAPSWHATKAHLKQKKFEYFPTFSIMPEPMLDYVDIQLARQTLLFKLKKKKKKNLILIFF